MSLYGNDKEGLEMRITELQESGEQGVGKVLSGFINHLGETMRHVSRDFRETRRRWMARCQLAAFARGTTSLRLIFVGKRNS